MPKDYIAVRDSVYQKLLKKGLSRKNAMKRAKRIAAIWFYKKHGRPVSDYD